ncbi:ribonuclease G [Oxobacter pfennigii]|uniref:Ribonuclease G n=1 Tax=Oxobacter pfennigii TaxID=36849 RepID=A0A0P8WNN7_9CLOT|nr:Rne/Rng family ribonuclease [Oxobacter pfennigii]KPU44167.1 ribonuclease G [Oxobacter pfennigii]
MNEIYIDAGRSEFRAVVLDDGELAEIHIDRQNKEAVSGNIYKGRVENVLPGMQAAFIDIGLQRNAFLYVKDALPYNLYGSHGKDEISIKSILNIGDEIIVQVSKEPSGGKGARVTTHIAIPGRFMVLMPGIDYIGISRRIEDEEERHRLKDLANKLKPQNAGIIVRTEAEGKTEEDFTEDINFLLILSNKIYSEFNVVKAPRLLHKDMDLVYKSLRDLFTRNTKKLVINDLNSYKRAQELIGFFSPSQKKDIEYYEGSANIFDAYGIEGKIEKALSRKVWLKSGGYIVIDHTEALTSIDVNTGKFTGSISLKDTVLSTNKEAAKEIARQLRIRDIGGIVIIDFIDMENPEHRQMVVDILRKELKKDRTKSSVLGITQLGLVEMTRKKAGKRLNSILQKNCPLCQGSGRILDEECMVQRLENKLEQIVKESDAPGILIEVNDAVEHYLKNSYIDYAKSLEDTYKRRIILKGFSNIDYSVVNIKLLDQNEINTEHKNPVNEGDKIEIRALKSKYINASKRQKIMDGIVSEVLYNQNGEVDKIMVDISNKG